MIRKYDSFLRFGIVGCINTFNYYIIYLVFRHFGTGYLESHTVGYILSMVGSFYLNCWFTYKVKPTWKKFIQFPMTYIVNYVVSALSLLLFVHMLHVGDWIA